MFTIYVSRFFCSVCVIVEHLINNPVLDFANVVILERKPIVASIQVLILNLEENVEQ